MYLEGLNKKTILEKKKNTEMRDCYYCCSFHKMKSALTSAAEFLFPREFENMFNE